MHRRALLQAAALASAGATLWPVHPAAAAPAVRPDARFLLVFLRGGYDGLSALVPRERTFYDEVRLRIALPAERLQPLDADWALHPALADTLQPLLAQQQVVFIPFAGTPNNSRSHFDTQDSIELGLAARLTDGTAGRDHDTGLLNRLAQQLPGRSAIGFTDQLPLALRGALPVPNIALRSLPRPAAEVALQASLQAMYAQHPLQARVASGLALREQVARDLATEPTRNMASAAPAIGMAMADPAGQEMAAASRQAASPSAFEREARRVAALLREQYSIGFLDIGGWDTHYNQGGAIGQLAGRLADLGRGLTALADELGPTAWQRTVVVVISEFGRTVRENGTLGTDHGHGTVYWVLGGGVRGSAQVQGKQLAVTASTLHRDRELPVLNDYRGLLAGIWARQFGLKPRATEQIFRTGTPASQLELL